MRYLCLVLLLAGCSKPTPPPVTGTVGVVDTNNYNIWDGTNTWTGSSGEPSTTTREDRVYAELWRICKEKHLTYEVHCYKGLGCSAIAWPSQASWYNDMDHWRAFTKAVDPTKAAEELVGALKGQPNEIVDHKSFSSVVDKHPETFSTGEIRP